MVSEAVRELIWHDDGHELHLRIERDQIAINPLACPHGESEDATCYHRGLSGCVVRYFIQMYGLECNEGICPPDETMPIAWAFHGDLYDIDACRVWIMPKADTDFAGWLEVEQQKMEELDESTNS